MPSRQSILFERTDDRRVSSIPHDHDTQHHWDKYRPIPTRGPSDIELLRRRAVAANLARDIQRDLEPTPNQFAYRAKRQRIIQTNRNFKAWRDAISKPRPDTVTNITMVNAAEYMGMPPHKFFALAVRQRMAIQYHDGVPCVSYRHLTTLLLIHGHAPTIKGPTKEARQSAPFRLKQILSQNPNFALDRTA